mgnify:FL=1
MIYVNGDSWSQRSNIDPDYSWPCILQSKAKCQVINQSAGCGSNSRMLSNLQKFYQTGARPKIILIGLTIYSRWHLPSKMGSSWNIGTMVVINDRFGEKNDEILPFYINYVYDEIEYIYQMYNQIWQMQELATNYFKCPIIFFNSWSSPDNYYHLATMHKEIYKDPESWIATRVDDTDDIAIKDYIHAFNFFKTKLDDWNLVLDTWSDLVYNHIDDEKGLHPGHPSPQGHKMICNNVLDTIEQSYPLLHKELV